MTLSPVNLPPQDDVTWAALCAWDEARGETYEGQAAVVEIIKHRMALKYSSDGTVKDTVLWKFQFSGFWFAMDHGHYEQIEKDAAGAEQEAGVLLAQAQGTPTFEQCLIIAKQVLAGTYVWPGPEGQKLAACPTAVLYYNPAVCAAPAWAIPANSVATIGHHEFFKT